MTPKRLFAMLSQSNLFGVSLGVPTQKKIYPCEIKCNHLVEAHETGHDARDLGIVYSQIDFAIGRLFVYLSCGILEIL